MEYIIYVATLILAVAMVYIGGGDLVVCGFAVILIIASTVFVCSTEDKHIIHNTIKAIDSELVSQHKARKIVPPNLCLSVRAHYVRQFKSIKALKGTDCASGLLVVTKTKVEK